MRPGRHAAFVAGAIFLTGLSFGDVALAQQRETIGVESSFRGKPLKITAQIYLPDKRSAEKIPAMIISHGSGGVRDVREGAYAREFNKLGVAGVVIDSFAPRGVASTVRDQSTVGSYDMLVDAVGTLKAVARHPAIDSTRIGIIGFSKGGTVVVKSALRRYMKPLADDEVSFSLLIAMYPWCGDQPLDFHPANGAPLYMLLGAEDRYVGTEVCGEFGNKLAVQGGKVEIKVYPGAQHGWDVPGSAHWGDAKGENARNCRYDETTPGTWVERSSGIKVMEGNKPNGNGKKAAARCMTHGVSGGYDKQVHAQSLQDIRGAIREAFRLP